jgi:membrane fusion protein (multidrug efflux system)
VVATVAAVPGETFTGEVSAINTSVNPETRTVRIRATLPNPDGKLRPGMFATVMTRHPEQEAVLTLPRTAVSYNTYGDYVFLIEENDSGQLTVTRRSVKTGEVRGNQVAITSGLEEGDQVVAKGLLRLRAGQPIEIQQEDDQPAEAS